MEEKKRNKKEVLKEIMSYVIILVIVVLLRIFVLLNSSIPTGSMENTIPAGTRVMGLKTAYLTKDPQRGDIVIFYMPDMLDEGEKLLYAKRVIGLPGETVEIRDGVLYIDGAELQEDYLAEPMTGDFGPYTVPEDGYFMMGDNRNHSADARSWSRKYVRKDEIVGKVYFSYWPKLKWMY